MQAPGLDSASQSNESQASGLDSESQSSLDQAAGHGFASDPGVTMV